ncbi:MAG: hypothetical protein M1320_01565 [Patescibacteria group bacterium]|nr:hypothetical protein [Patescibacteria group bacterium]
MKNKKLFLLFSHGFGNQKDDRGLFPDIVRALGTPDNRMFDYNDINAERNVLTVKPLYEQVKILKKNLDEIQSNPENDVVLICHSQGCLIPSLLGPENIKHTIFIAPQHNISIYRMVNMFKDRPGSEINLSGTSVFARRDGSKTLVPPEYWRSIKNIDPISLFNDFSRKTKLYIFVPTKDEVLGKTDFSNISSRACVDYIESNHDFTDGGRHVLFEKIKSAIYPT